MHVYIHFVTMVLSPTAGARNLLPRFLTAKDAKQAKNAPAVVPCSQLPTPSFDEAEGFFKAVVISLISAVV